MSQTRRVLSAQIAHETNTFSIVPTTLEDYRKRLFLLDTEIAAALADTRMEIAAHLAAAKRYGWTLVQPVAASATPSGKVTAECWAELQRLVYAACETGPLDGVILALHGAMVTETDDDAEGALLEGLRKRLGEKIPIALTLDLHANVTERMGRLANIMLPYRTYPHIDQYETAFRAAELLQAAMDGTIRPKVVRLQGPLLDGCNHGRTQGGVMSDLLARAADMQAQAPGLLSVDVCAGFSRSDIAEVGPSVQVTYDASHNAAEAAARQAAAALQDEMVQRRAEVTVTALDLPTATKLAVAAAADVADTRPLVIADFSDNPGSGAYGDGVRLLEALLQAEVRGVLFGVLGDPEAAARCHDAGLGASLDVVVGAKRHPASYGPPLTLTGRVTGLSDGAFVCEGPMNAGQPMTLGPSALLEVDGISIAISTNTLQTYDREMFRILGAEPAQFRIVAVKSAHHFRAAFGPMAKEVILADSGGLATFDHTRLLYRTSAVRSGRSTRSRIDVLASRDTDRSQQAGDQRVSARLNFRQIEAFRAVMLTGTTIAAANMLNTTQPSISRSLAQIQAAAKLKLFELDRGRLRPTPEAVMLFEAVQRNFLGLETIEETVALLRRSGVGRLRLACTPALGMSVMPAVLARFKQRHPDVHITLRTISSYDVREGLMNGLYDLGITTNSLDLEGTQLQTKVVDQVAAVCVMSRSHPLAANAHITPRHFQSETLLTLDREDDLSDAWRRALAQAKVTPSSVIETTYSATICRLAEAGAGIGVVNPYVASVFAGALRVLPTKPAIGVKVFVAYPRHVAMSALAAALITEIGDHFKQDKGKSGKR